MNTDNRTQKLEKLKKEAQIKLLENEYKEWIEKTKKIIGELTEDDLEQVGSMYNLLLKARIELTPLITQVGEKVDKTIEKYKKKLLGGETQ